MKFIRMRLDDGGGPDGRILAKSTVEMAAQNQLGDLKIKMLPGVIPALSDDGDPDLPVRRSGLGRLLPRLRDRRLREAELS